MSIRSIYGTGPDEEYLFLLTAPSSLPEADDESAAMQEAEWLSSSDYGDNQDEFDERESQTGVRMQAIPTLSPDEVEAVLQFIARLRV